MWVWAVFLGGSALAMARGEESRGLLAVGTPWETPYFLRDSGVEGPTVLVVAGIHGDEPAGVEAAERIRRWPLRRGKLVVLPRANRPALEARRRLTPGVDSQQANLNRNFPLPDGSREALGTPAKEIWHFVEALRPDWLLDLHEGAGFRRTNRNSVGSSIIVFPHPEALQAAEAILEEINRSIAEAEKKFVLLKPPIRGSLARAAGERWGCRAMILETTKRGQPLEKRVRQHGLMVRSLLLRLEMLPPDFPLPESEGLVGDPPPP